MNASNTNVLMLSSSREADTGYLTHAIDMINQTLGDTKTVLFIPYAGVTITPDEYTQMVRTALPQLEITGIHQHHDAKQAVLNAEAILVGGGNTFVLLDSLYQFDLLKSIRNKVKDGMPYIGWSAGSNICGTSIKTTNDMPIVEPPSFTGLGFLPFQINPHYSDYQAPGHNGETREQRLMEFSTLSPKVPVVGIREGSALKLVGKTLKLIGAHDGVLIKAGINKVISANTELTQLMTTEE